jgi:hypothetical protein
MDIKKNPRNVPGASDEIPDAKTLERAKEIFLLFAHAVSAMKLFPPYHSTVLKFQDDLFEKLKAFLDENWELEIRIEENAFVLGTEIVFRDDNIIKSLPYLFFKDGMYALTFLRDLERDELQGFLDTIKTASLLPADVGDIVDALWELDLTHIRYYAPDDFLEAKLASGRTDLGGLNADHYRLDLRINPDELYKGRIELSREDLEDISKRLLDLRQKENKTETEFATLSAALDMGDVSSIETMLKSDRRISTEKDLLDLLFELLYLEERIAPFKIVLGYLEKHHRDLVQKANFTHAVLILTHLEELALVLADKSPDRVAEIAKCLRSVYDQVPFDKLHDLAGRGQIGDIHSFLEYLRRLGPRALRVGAELLHADQDPNVRSAAFNFLAEVGKENLNVLAGMAQEHNPYITKAIIAVFDSLNDKKTIPFLAAFMNYKSKDIKAEAIRALARFSDLLAHKILLGFLRDQDEDIRVAAAKKIRLDLHPDLVKAVMSSVAAKEFSEKLLREKEAILKALGRSRSDEAGVLLRSLLEKTSFLDRAKSTETRLCVVKALEVMATPMAVEILRSCEKNAGKKIKEACRLALDRLKAGPGGS